jgi:hypothetical protein
MSARGWAPGAVLAWALTTSGCSHAPQTWVVQCSAASERPPRPTAECFADPASQYYAALLAGEVGDALSGSISHPGSAALSVAFDGDARVGDVCFESFRGKRIGGRIPDTAARVQALPAAPACFAGRRLDFAWESDAVTDEEVRRATAECRRETQPYRRHILFMLEAQSCYEPKGCSGREVRRRWDEADRALRSCVLGRVPLVMRTGITHEALVFDPAPDTTPDPDQAMRASKVCDGLPRPPDVIDCMQRRGWEPRTPAQPQAAKEPLSGPTRATSGASFSASNP